MAVYHQILNIMGDRMRNNPSSSIALTGSSDNNPKEGKLMAENIKQYLVGRYGIDPSRISVEGKDKPAIPSEQPGATKELALLREGDRRVDITTNSPELMLQVGGSPTSFLKPVQIKAVQADPMDSHVVLDATGANDCSNHGLLNVPMPREHTTLWTLSQDRFPSRKKKFWK